MIKAITYRDVEESPMWNGSSLRGDTRVPGQVKDGQKREMLVVKGKRLTAWYERSRKMDCLI